MVSGPNKQPQRFELCLPSTRMEQTASFLSPQSSVNAAVIYDSPFSASVEAVDTKSGTKVVGRTSDLSLGGCYIDTLSPFPVGTDVKIRIVRNAQTFEAQSKVVYSLIGMGMGLAFRFRSAEASAAVSEGLLEISGQAPTAPDASAAGPEEPAPSERTQALTKSSVLSELIMTLMKKKVLTETEGKDLLRKLFT